VEVEKLRKKTFADPVPPAMERGLCSMYGRHRRTHLVRRRGRAPELLPGDGSGAFERRPTMHTRTWIRVLTGILAIAGMGLASDALAGGDDKKAGAFIDREIKMMDTNGDKTVSVDEHAAGARKMFATMDANTDGKVTAQEMEASRGKVTGQKAKKSAMSAADKIKVCDTDTDGALTTDEHTGCARKMFETMDANKDGQLSRPELVSGHAKMMHGGPEGAHHKMDPKSEPKTDR
jgi:Ca2+-binding EF-hand superfamily protein